MVRQTSLQAFNTLKRSGTLSRKEKQIYWCFKEHGVPATALEISDVYRLPINEVSGRISGLVQKQWLMEVGTKPNRTGHSACLWWFTDEPIPEEAAQ